MTITARYASTCPTCSHAITPGQQVEWTRGSQARHVDCGASVPRTTAAPARRPARRPGRWTGCSCGSREDRDGDLIPSDSNCASCEYDA